MDKIKLYNSLSRGKEEFIPIKAGEAGIYTCGPTVYDFAHIGNLRAYIFADTLVRVLKFNGLKAKWVMNITDVDDKTIAGSKKKFPDLGPMEALKRYTEMYEKYFWEDLERLNIPRPDRTPRATETIPEMLELVGALIEKSFAYEKDGSVYFNIKKYAEKYSYGQLADLDLSRMKSGVRVSADEYEKEDVNDFALWKAAKEGEPAWDSPWGRGRPGWHIECSAMSEKELGLPFDIHTGGVDLKFPHHEDELAQSAAGRDCQKPVNYWMHNEHLLVDNKKMSKSLGNFYTLRDLEEKAMPDGRQGVNPLAFRFLCLQTHYRSKMNFTWESLEAAKKGLNHLRNQVRALTPHLEAELPSGSSASKCREFEEKFLAAANDDLNMPRALAAAQELLKSGIPSEEKLATILHFDEVLGLNLAEAGKQEEIPEEIKALAEKREAARQAKNWAESDALREKIRSLGYEIEDTDKGYSLRKK
ncbi:MAG: cysteine--tRNA ligase [bacterium]|nr:cysteine--tRNA ligase [bacterium]